MLLRWRKAKRIRRLITLGYLLAELIPSVQSLSQEDKILLLNLVTSELTQDMGLVSPNHQTTLNPGHGRHDSYEAAAILAQFLSFEPPPD